jgi:hypothetical protein
MSTLQAEPIFYVEGLTTRWPAFMKCPECGGRMKHIAHRLDYKCTNGVVLPMLVDEADYRCENDDECGMLWCEDGACGA